jgi:hypothetical protein
MQTILKNMLKMMKMMFKDLLRKQVESQHLIQIMPGQYLSYNTKRFFNWYISK